MYRIKTEQEFEQEFGENWRSILNYGWNPKMDYLFNQPLTQKQIDILNAGKTFRVRDNDGYYWTIARDMMQYVDNFQATINGNTVTVKITVGNQTFTDTAKCSPNDDFDIKKGLAVALYRLAHRLGEYEREYVVVKTEKANILDEIK